MMLYTVFHRASRVRRLVEAQFHGVDVVEIEALHSSQTDKLSDVAPDEEHHHLAAMGEEYWLSDHYHS